MGFYFIPSNIDEVLAIIPVANVIVFGGFNFHCKGWLTYSNGTNRPNEISNRLTQMVNLDPWLWLSHFCTFDLFISFDANICSKMAFPPLGVSDHVFVLVSIDFLPNSKQDAPFHCIACNYCRADWDGFPWLFEICSIGGYP